MKLMRAYWNENVAWRLKDQIQTSVAACLVILRSQLGFVKVVEMAEQKELAPVTLLKVAKVVR